MPRKSYIFDVTVITLEIENQRIESLHEAYIEAGLRGAKLRTKHFALRVIRLYRSLPRTEEARILGTQLLRSSTSIGANYRAACRGRSHAEFVAKLGIVLEEADETVFWRNSFRKEIFFRKRNCVVFCKRRTNSSQFSSLPCAPRKV